MKRFGHRISVLVPVKNGKIAGTFLSADVFKIYDVWEDTVKEVYTLKNDYAEIPGTLRGLAKFLYFLGVDFVVAPFIERDVVENLLAFGILVKYVDKTVNPVDAVWAVYFSEVIEKKACKDCGKYGIYIV